MAKAAAGEVCVDALVHALTTTHEHTCLCCGDDRDPCCQLSSHSLPVAVTEVKTKKYCGGTAAIETDQRATPAGNVRFSTATLPFCETVAGQSLSVQPERITASGAIRFWKKNPGGDAALGLRRESRIPATLKLLRRHLSWDNNGEAITMAGTIT